MTRVAAAFAAVFTFGVLGVSSASATGILPPANPAADCDPAGASAQFTLSALNGCRAKEGVGPLLLPANWQSLTAAQQLFVLVDLERVNRGLAPVVGLSSALDQLAAAGASADTDPSFPGGGFNGGGGVWFGGQNAVAADYAWMYDDGPDGLDINVDCPRTGSTDCWLHRDILLWKGTGGPLVAGGGAAGNSFSLEILSGYSTAGLSFTWAQELKYFPMKPAAEPLSPQAQTATGSPVDATSTGLTTSASEHSSRHKHHLHHARKHHLHHGRKHHLHDGRKHRLHDGRKHRVRHGHRRRPGGGLQIIIG